MRSFGLATLLACACMGLVACGGAGSGGSGSGGGPTTGGGDGSGGDGRISGIAMPTQLSVVLAQSDDTRIRGLRADFAAFAGRGVIDVSQLPQNSDFRVDGRDSWVYDESISALQMVNEILCYIEQTAADQMVNQGPYTALLNTQKCEQGQSSGGGPQNAGASRVSYEKWFINVTRASNSAPQIVHIWVPDTSGPGDLPQTILVEITVTAGVGDSAPFGSFVMNFRGVVRDPLDGSPVETMAGTLRTVDNGGGQPQFTLFNSGSGSFDDPSLGNTDWSVIEAANVLLNSASGGGGVARTYTNYTQADITGSYGRANRYAIAFNDSHFARDGATVQTVDGTEDTTEQQSCTSRDDYDSHVWRYNLYDRDTGERAAIKAGLPFGYDHDDDPATAAIQGWVGYWGYWLDDATIDLDGATITGYGGTRYTVDVAPGKLIYSAARAMDMADLAGHQLYYSSYDPNTNTTYQYLVKVLDPAAPDLVATDLVTAWTENGPQLTPIAPTSILDGASDGAYFHLWADGLGGKIIYVHDSLLAPTARQVAFFEETTVLPKDLAGHSSVTLWCYDRCLVGGVSGTPASEAEVYYEYWNPDFTPRGPFTYTLDTASMTLFDDLNGLPVDYTSVDLGLLGYQWGINSGDMVTTPLPDPYAPWEIYGVTESFRWDTGADGWNQLAVVRRTSDNSAVAFDKPLQFTYRLQAGDERNGRLDHVGETFLLEYGGNGELWGFPSELSADLTRWYPAVDLKDGVVLGPSGEYVVKAVEMEQTMRDAPGECGALTPPAPGELPLPQAAAGVVTLAPTPPTVGGPPSVVEGQLVR